MIDDLDKTIEELLKNELPELFGDNGGQSNGQVSISFATPDSNFAASRGNQPTINIFLYDIRENLELRTSEQTILERKSSSKGIKTRPSAQIDFSYMITAWAGEKTDPPPVFDEHRLLSDVMVVLLRHFIIPDDVLQGKLKGIKPLPRAFAIQAGRLQSLGEFWQALGGKPKAALNYTVTANVDVHKPKDVDLATEVRIGYQEKKTPGKGEEDQQQLSIVGRIIDDAETPAPISSARVEIVDHSEQTIKTATDGYFQFTNLPDGKYTLKASLSGYDPSEHKATVKRDKQGVVDLKQIDMTLTKVGN